MPGMAASRFDGRRLTDHLVEEFSELGYNVTAIKLNAADYLVPQLRTRVFIVGSLFAPVSKPNPVEFASSAYGIDVANHDVGVRAALAPIGV